MGPRIAISCDHGGFDLKTSLVNYIKEKSIECTDLGVFTDESVDYPENAHALVAFLQADKADFGILICGTGIGISIAANRHKGIRAALCTDVFMARMSREHNDANVLCLGGRVIAPNKAEHIVDAFISAEFEGGRHVRRIEKIEIR